MPTWDVGVTATARATFQANGARGAMPLMFNAEAFPGAICNDAVETCTPTVYQLPGQRDRVRAAGRHVVQLDGHVHGQRQPVQRRFQMGYRT